jgi:hypothetical protein
MHRRQRVSHCTLAIIARTAQTQDRNLLRPVQPVAQDRGYGQTRRRRDHGVQQQADTCTAALLPVGQRHKADGRCRLEYILQRLPTRSLAVRNQPRRQDTRCPIRVLARGRWTLDI